MFSVYSSTYVLVKMLHYKSYEIMNFDCWFKLNCKIFGSWLYLMHACYVIDGFIFFLLQHMTWYAICILSSYTLINIIPMLDEIIVKRGRRDEFWKKIFGVVEKSIFFSSWWNFFLLKRGRSFLLDFWARCVHLYEVCFLPLLFLFFQTPKHF